MPPPAAAGALAALDEVGAAAGALVVAAAAGALAAGVDDDDVAGVVDFLLLQPAMPSPATAEIAISLIAVLFMHDPLYWDGRKAWLPRVQLVVAHNISCCGAQHMHVGCSAKEATVPKSCSEPIRYMHVIM